MSKLIENAKNFVFELFKNELDSSFLYHNFTHTERVLRSLNEIIENSEVSKSDTEILQLAAWFHDTGYTKKREGHEEESVKIATAFLKDQKADDDLISAVNDCIMATKFKDTPTTKLGKIIRDADSSHFGKKYFVEASEFLRKELELQGVATYTPREWLDENLKTLSKKHEFYTDYALKKLAITKREKFSQTH